MFSTYRERAARQVRHWSLEQKVGQLFILAFPGKQAEVVRTLIERYRLGGCYLSQDNAATFAEARQLTGELDRINQATGDAVPLLLGVDQEGAWSVLMPESTTGPGNLALGHADDVSLTASMYQVFADEMRSAGFNCVLGPCADVNLRSDSPIIDARAFGSDPALVARHVAAAVAGVRQGGLVACAKHFPGHGDTAVDSHREIPVVDKPLATLLEQDLLPFQSAIDAGVELIMTSHIRYPQLDAQHPATLSAPVLRGLLRERLGFNGIVISDSMNMGAIRRNYSPVDAAVLAFQSGIDMMMLSEEHYDHQPDYLERQLAMIDGLVAAVRDGRWSEAELDATLLRVVSFKLARLSGIAHYLPLAMREHQALAQRAAQAAVAVLTDPAGNLPVSAEREVFLIQTAPQEAYHGLMNARGIGPNQHVAAFDVLADSWFGAHKQLHAHSLTYEVAVDWLRSIRVQPHMLAVAVLENYPLPGEDFPQAPAQALLFQLAEVFGQQLLVISLSNGQMRLPAGVSHLCAYGSRPCSARAAVRTALGL
ncbi:glycoside hydrolase family 3 N-terminal domain-containing protein [Pseudoduganella danionis]|uniref:beta-N-acetylhexosaminidase n=1 Tax=Pseudoduganella danionis TaxID=1890295 RepID=A0ABW9STG7_9BURK|nr:glycoside hydrolase family 3 N-terminal domain-containing protein [Pseudoduganella danionis]MTW35471.1 glycosyl hydrolase family 3 [Pseudoduganella danionis]